MTLSEMTTAVEGAQAELRRADILADQLARILRGRLRHVESAWLLDELKQELRAYNIKTKSWRNPQ